jgi:hypothetical protein
MQFITNQELIDFAKAAYLDGRLTAQLDKNDTACLYQIFIDGRDCRCAIGAAFSDKTMEKIREERALSRNVSYISDLEIVTFEDLDFAGVLQVTHDNWVEKVHEDSPFVEGEKLEFLKLIGL